MKTTRCFGLCLPLLLAGAAAFAAPADKPADDSAAAPEEKPAAAATFARPGERYPASAPKTQLELRSPADQDTGQDSYVLPAWLSKDVTGSANRYEKYLVLPVGPFLETLRYSGLRGNYRYLTVQMNGVGQAASSNLVRWENAFPFNYLQLTTDRYRFYLYPDAGPSLRQNLGLAGGATLADSKTFVGVSLRNTDVTVARATAADPQSPISYRSQNFEANISRPLGTSDAAADVQVRGFTDRTGLQPGSNQVSYRLNYTANLPLLSSIGASYGVSQVHVGSQDPRTESFAVQAVSPAAAPVVATVGFDAFHLSNAIQQTAYNRSASTARFGVSYHGLPGVLLRAGYDRREYERVDRLHTAVDKPVWDNAYATLSYRPFRRWQVVAKALYRENPNPAPSELSDPLSLTYNLDRGAEVRLQGAPTDTSMVYFAANTRYRKNTRRNVELQTDNTSIGGWLQLGDWFSVNADYSVLWNDSRNLLLAFDPDSNLATGLADARVTTIGTNFTITPKLSLDGNYSHLSASRAQSISQDVFGIAARRQLPGGANWYVEFRRDLYRDQLAPSQSYTANVVGVGGSAKF